MRSTIKSITFNKLDKVQRERERDNTSMSLDEIYSIPTPTPTPASGEGTLAAHQVQAQRPTEKFLSHAELVQRALDKIRATGEQNEKLMNERGRSLSWNEISFASLTPEEQAALARHEKEDHFARWQDPSLPKEERDEAWFDLEMARCGPYSG